MIGTKKIVIVNGTNEEDIDMLADCVVRASENVVYHSILDGVKHIAHMANIHYPSKDSEKPLVSFALRSALKSSNASAANTIDIETTRTSAIVIIFFISFPPSLITRS